MLNASNLKARGFSLGFGWGLECAIPCALNVRRNVDLPIYVSLRDNVHPIQFGRLLEISEKMLKASNLKAPGFSLGFGMCNPLRAESTPER